jgi:cytoskeletal protein CcmA (bactofilin family)
MLKKSKKPEDEKGYVDDKITERKTLSPIPQSETRTETTIIGENITIEGDIRGAEHLVIEGSMKGNIQME